MYNLPPTFFPKTLDTPNKIWYTIVKEVRKMCDKVYTVLSASQAPLTVTQLSSILTDTPIPAISKALWHMLFLGKVERIVKKKKVFWKTLDKTV